MRHLRTKLYASGAGLERYPLRSHRIGFEISVLYGRLPPVIKHLRAINTHLDIDLRALSAPEQVAAIRNGAIDVGLGRELISDDHVEQTVIRQEPFLVALYASHILAADNPPSLRFADLAGDTFISYHDQSTGRRSDPVARLMDRANFVPVRKTEIRDVLADLGLVAAEAGICIVPATVQRMRSTDVCYKPLDEEDATSSIVLSVARGSTSPIVGQIKDELERLLQG
ncbi:MAG TPA: LysR substrate-binding domain-containing protein [Acetobacteraceae bacterium]|nr:LysR substrate-binding domain-containing protein [Acetobacteraceae bacterium]